MNSEEQIKSLIEKSQNILIVPSLPLKGDSFAAVLALFYTLKKLNKNVNILIKEIPSEFQFLIPPASEDFIITINNLDEKISGIHYEKKLGRLNLYLNLKNGRLSAKDVSFASKKEGMEIPCLKNSFLEEMDTIITLGIQQFETVERLFQNNSSNLYKASILNIDNNSLNRNFGQMNIVNPKDASLSALIYEFIKSIDKNIFDKKISTCLLGGIIFTSKNFQDIKSTPRLLKIADHLIKQGGDYQKIIRNIYKDASIPQIKLLSKILEKLKKKENLYYTTLSMSDFNETETSSKDLSFIIKELMIIGNSLFPNC